jgi:hypothetical protein
MFEPQVIVMSVARGLIRCLPPSTTWSLFITNEEADSVFNVFVTDEEQRVRMRKTLGITSPLIDEGDDFETYKMDGLWLSIIEKDNS